MPVLAPAIAGWSTAFGWMVVPVVAAALRWESAEQLQVRLASSRASSRSRIETMPIRSSSRTTR